VTGALAADGRESPLWTGWRSKPPNWIHMKPMQVNRSPGRAWRTKQECPSAYR